MLTNTKGNLKHFLLLSLLVSQVLASPMAIAQVVPVTQLAPGSTSNNKYYEVPCPDRSGCETIALEKEDTDRLLEMLFNTEKAFRGAEVEGGKVTGEELLNPNFLSTDVDGEQAADQNIPVNEIDATSHPLIGQYCGGPFSVASRLKEDLRVAQCRFDENRMKDECEAIYGDAGFIKQIKEEFKAGGGGDVFEDDFKKNHILPGTFDSRMLCTSDDDCSFIIFSQYERMFNFTVSMVDVATTFIPVAKTLLSYKFKVLGNKNLLERFKLVGPEAREIPIISSIIRRTWPPAIDEEIKDLTLAKLQADPELYLKYSNGFKDVASINKAKETVLVQQELLKDATGKVSAGNATAFEKLTTEANKLEDLKKFISPWEKAKIAAAGGFQKLGDEGMTAQAFTEFRDKGTGRLGASWDSVLTHADGDPVNNMTKLILEDQRYQTATGVDWVAAKADTRWASGMLDAQKDDIAKITSTISADGKTIEFVRGTTSAVNKDALVRFTDFANRGVTRGGFMEKMPRSFGETMIDNVFKGEGGVSAVLNEVAKGIGAPLTITIAYPAGRLIQRTGGADFGLNGQAIAAYRIPRTWGEFELFPKTTDEIYYDAYIDIFFNKKTDNGMILDQWVRGISKIPEGFLDVIRVGNFVKEWREKKDRIERVEDGLVFLTTLDAETITTSEAVNPQKGFTINPLEGSAVLGVKSNDRLRAISLEIMERKDLNRGSVVSLFGHHVDIRSRVGMDENSPVEEGEGVNLEQAKKDGKGCADNWLTRDFGNLLPDNWPLSDTLNKLNMSPATILTATNNNGWPIFLALTPLGSTSFIASTVATLAGQVLLNKYTGINDCIDTTGGYYVTGYVKTGQDLVEGTTAEDTLKELNLGFLEGSETTPDINLPGFDSNKLKELDKNIKDLIGETAGTHPKVIEIQTDTRAFKTIDDRLVQPAGSMQVHGLFSLWTQGSCFPSSPLEETKTTVFRDDEGNVIGELIQGPTGANFCTVNPEDANERTCLLDDFDENGEKGRLLNMAAFDARLAAYTVPQKVVRMQFREPDPIMRVHSSPAQISMNQEAFNCMRDYSSCTSVSVQGVGLSDVTKLTGDPRVMVLEDGSSVHFGPDVISVVGSNPYVSGKSAYVTVDADRTVKMNDLGGVTSLGKLNSFITSKGVFTRESPTSEAMLFWLKDLAQASPEDIVGLEVEQYLEDCNNNKVLGGFNVAFSPDPTSIGAKERVGQLNNAAAALGPFKVFETESKVYYFHLDDSCQQRLRVIDKETGEVEEFEVYGVQYLGDNTFLLDTDKGMQKFKFDEKDGQLTLNVNDGLTQLLTKLIGQNGTIVFDPESAVYRALNAQTLPLLDLFKNGLSIKADDSGRVFGVPGTNIAINVPGAGGAGAFNLPWAPENALQALALFALILGAVLAFRTSAVQARLKRVKR